MSRARRPSRALTGTRRGFTLIELMLALLIGLVILSSATSIALSMWRDMAGVRLREGVVRHARFVGMALERDLQETGVSLESEPRFGSIGLRNDSLSILGVPFEPTEAPIYRLAPPSGTTALLPAGGTCGARCVNVKAPVAGAPVALAVGDLAMMSIDGARRLIRVSGVTPRTDSTAVTFMLADSLLHRPANFAPAPGSTVPIQLRRGSTSIQELRSVMYWREGDRLMRAERINDDRTYDGAVVAERVRDWQVTLIFTDGDEADAANLVDSDPTNDYDDVIGVRARLVLLAERTDPRVNGGAPVERTYEWRFTPRNLMYERNRRR